MVMDWMEGGGLAGDGLGIMEGGTDGDLDGGDTRRVTHKVGAEWCKCMKMAVQAMVTKYGHSQVVMLTAGTHMWWHSQVLP